MSLFLPKLKHQPDEKTIFTIILSLSYLMSVAQIKMHSTGQVSIQSTGLYSGVQIETTGKTSFEPNITQSYSALNQTKAPTRLVRAWNVVYTGTPALSPADRFYVTGKGDAYANGHYAISGGSGGGSKGSYPIGNASEKISSLNGYYYDNDEFEGFEPDFIDNPNILPEAIRHDPEGMIYINYSAVIPVLVEAFKEQQRTIEALQREIADLKTDDKGYNGVENQNTPSNTLYQNSPNPTNSSTTIECYLDSYVQKAMVAIYDLNGLQLKEYPVYHQGKNTITIKANEFKPGIYMYSLLVDGKLVDTKRMIITSK